MAKVCFNRSTRDFGGLTAGFRLDLKDYYNGSTTVVVLQIDGYALRERARERECCYLMLMCQTSTCPPVSNAQTTQDWLESLLFQQVLEHSSLWLRGFHSFQILHTGTVQERVRTRAYFLYMDGCRDEKRNYFQAHLVDVATR